MVSAILSHYEIDDPLPTRGTFGDPGSNPGADNFFFFFFWSLLFSFSSTCLVLSTCSYYINCFSTWYVRLLLEKIQKIFFFFSGFELPFCKLIKAREVVPFLSHNILT